MRTRTHSPKTAFALVELAAVMCVLAILFTLGVTVYRGARLSTRVATAQNNLRQVASYLELYFRKFGYYPPQGSDLVEALGSVGADTRVLSNPLLDEGSPGDTVTGLYRAPTLNELDRPDVYLTAMVSDNGYTAVILHTGGRIERCEDIYFDPSNLPAILAMLADPPATQVTQTGSSGGPEPRFPEYVGSGESGGEGTGGEDTGGEGEGDEETGGDVPDDAGFDLDDDGATVTKVCSDVYIHVLGSQFGYADGTMVDIVTAAKLGGGDWFALFGSQAAVGGETLRLTSIQAGTRVLIRAEISDPYTRWLWTKCGYPLAYTANDGTGQVVTLRDGDMPICNKPGFPYQVGVQGLLSPYTDSQTGRIAIGAEQALYCFDFNPLGSTATGIDYNDLVILATATVAETSCEEEAPGAPGDMVRVDPTLAGQLNINPNNKSDFEFELVKPDGSSITRDHLLANRNLKYLGPATSIRVRPKGNGNQNTLTLDGAPYQIKNGSTYLIEQQPGGYMTVYLYNDGGNGMGKWWITISATGATIRKL